MQRDDPKTPAVRLFAKMREGSGTLNWDISERIKSHADECVRGYVGPISWSADAAMEISAGVWQTNSPSA